MWKKTKTVFLFGLAMVFVLESIVFLVTLGYWILKAESTLVRFFQTGLAIYQSFFAAGFLLSLLIISPVGALIWTSIGELTGKKKVGFILGMLFLASLINTITVPAMVYFLSEHYPR